MRNKFHSDRMIKLASSLFAISMVCATVACSDDRDSSDASAHHSANQEGAWPRSVEDDQGTVEISSQPERIVSTSTTLTGSLLAIGAPVVASSYTGENIEGLTDENGFFTQWSEAAKKSNVEQLWSNAQPEVEKATNFDPDLIVVSKNGGDSSYEDIDKLEQIAPVVVIDYSDSDWKDVTEKLGEITGRESEAKAVLDKYNARKDEVRDSIDVSDAGKVSAFIIFGDDSGVAALTPESPHTRILKDVGFETSEIPSELGGNTEMGADRGDMINLSFENVERGLTGDTWIVVGADETNMVTFSQQSVLEESAQNREGRVHFLPSETFRLDYYSALMMLDSLEEQFA
ncbi:Ferrienterobactin-binding periplasmic protein [Corynebacterium provencense]|uniref:Ferrienterobactin-binding periplasmic protein n=2 Tax=Corynebacterium provencense TaxID=1737425 RepID=A0A2Z3YSI0_9CORY|nr:Ferrienterobactin-binding periplasmic protein [Corynebacterium provencense]